MLRRRSGEVGGRAAARDPARRELRFHEHVRANRALVARTQQAFDVVWPRIAGGCHAGCQTREAIERAGFQIESCDASSFRPFPLALPTAPHILGTARRPEE